jgi:hypothetical protein
VATYYGFGPEFQGAQVVMDGATGELLEIPAGIGPHSIPDSIADSRLLDVFDAPDTPIPDEPLRPYPRYAGGSSYGAKMFPVMPDAKRIGKYTLPAGTITKVRALVDGGGNGPGDPTARAVLFNSSGAVVAYSADQVFGRNQLTTAAFAGTNNAGTSVTADSAGVLTVTNTGTLGGEGVYFSNNGSPSQFGMFAGDTITLSIEARRVSGAGDVQFQARFGNAANNIVQQPVSSTMTLTDEWQRYSWSTTVPSDSTITQGGLKFLKANTSAGVFQVRNASMVRGANTDYYPSTMPASWREFTFSPAQTITADTYYVGLHTGSDLSPVTSVIGLTDTPNATLATYNFDSTTDGWTTSGTGAALAQTTASPRNGAGALQVTLTGNSAGDHALSPTMVAVLNTGDRVTASFWINPAVTTTFAAGFFANSTPQFNVQGTNTSCPANVWTKVSVSATISTTITNQLQMYVRTASGLTMVYKLDAATVQVQRRNNSGRTSMRIGGQDSPTQDANLSANPRGRNNTVGWSGWHGGLPGASQSFTRITNDGMWAGRYGNTCVEYTGTMGTGSSGFQLTSTPVMGTAAGDTVYMTGSFKIVAASSTITAMSLGVRGVSAGGTDFYGPGLSTITNPTVGRWYTMSGSYTLPQEFNTLQAMFFGNNLPGGATYQIRVGHFQITRKPTSSVVGIIDGDLPGMAWDGAVGDSSSRGPMGRVNYWRDPLTVSTSGVWASANSTVTFLNDATSPTGKALKVSANTSTDAYVALSALHDSNQLTVPATPGEQWTLSGWMNANQAAIDQYVTGGSQYKNGPSFWVTNNGAHTANALPMNQLPTVANTWVPFALTVTAPQLVNAMFVRLYNTQLGSSGPETMYTGLKLEKGTWPAGDYFYGGQTGVDWFMPGSPNNSESIKWQEPCIGDQFSTPPVALPAFTPTNPSITPGPVIQPVYATP